MIINQQHERVNLREAYPNTSFPPNKDVFEAPDGSTLYRVHPPRTTANADQVAEEDGYEFVQGKMHVKLAIRNWNADEKIAHLTAYREKRIVEGIVVNGIRIRGDVETITRLQGKKDKAVSDPTTTANWSSGGEKHVLNAAQIIGLWELGQGYMQACFDTFFEVKDNIANYTTAAEIESAFDIALVS